jgi:hypothetical protein
MGHSENPIPAPRRYPRPTSNRWPRPRPGRTHLHAQPARDANIPRARNVSGTGLNTPAGTIDGHAQYSPALDAVFSANAEGLSRQATTPRPATVGLPTTRNSRVTTSTPACPLLAGMRPLMHSCDAGHAGWCPYRAAIAGFRCLHTTPWRRTTGRRGGQRRPLAEKRGHRRSSLCQSIFSVQDDA